MSRPATVVRRVEDEAGRQRAYAIRTEVFVEEQAVPLELELDEHDPTADHVLAYDGDEPVGTGRLVLEDGGGVAHLGRIAVRAGARGRGVGVALITALEQLGRERGAGTSLLGAQVQALGFYERLGYVAEGPEFDDAGIAHRWMRKAL
ncbi:GNAT family N-acetyltransferase [Vallicoccus soli]|uniref:GNAT family N-acetyltransferase n=1 Tax=Vallicoccus soli TaxID=2339232 RepID=A0A3A3YYI5_9ACTN|nr:GNAT family N-acetyltransferase [Vallicoccus soli]RJK96810.1 GNAT family N-acetyltransferase [Vallicoccus soli]